MILGDTNIEIQDQYLGGALGGCKFQFTDPTGQHSGSISVYLSHAYADMPANKKGVFGIYDVATGQKIASSAETVGLIVGWNTIPLIGDFQLVNGAWYWLVVQTPAAFSVSLVTTTWGAVGTVPSQFMYVNTTTKPYDGTLPAALPTIAGSFAAYASIYASLEAAGDGGPVYGTNLAVIPDGWQINQYPNHQLDYTVVRTAEKPSIRLEPSPAGINTARECDGKWYSVKPGDHIIAKIYIHVDSLAGYTHPTDPWQIRGARLGIDLNGGGYNLMALPEESLNSYVEWGTTPSGTWILQTWEFIVPSTFFTKSLYPVLPSITPTQISTFAIWLQALLKDDQANAWFADAELYINPTETPPPPVSYVLDVWASIGGTTDPTGIQAVESGTEVTITATAAAGYRFNGWQVQAGMAQAVTTYPDTVNPLVLTITAATTVMPLFEFIQPPPVTYTCTICGAVYGTAADLADHMLVAHPTTPPTYKSTYIAYASGVSQADIAVLRVFGHRCLPDKVIGFYDWCGPQLARLVKYQSLKHIVRRMVEWLVCQLKKNLTL